MFVKRRRNLNINNNDMFLNRNYDKVLSEVGTDKNGNNNNNENGEVNFTEGNLMISKWVNQITGTSQGSEEV